MRSRVLTIKRELPSSLQVISFTKVIVANQHIQKLVYQTLNNILTKDQKKLFKKGKCFSCGTLGHFTTRCPNKSNFKTLPHNKTYKAKKNLFTKKTNKKRDLIENIPEEPTIDSNSDKEKEDFPQSN